MCPLCNPYRALIESHKAPYGALKERFTNLKPKKSLPPIRLASVAGARSVALMSPTEATPKTPRLTRNRTSPTVEGLGVWSPTLELLAPEPSGYIPKNLCMLHISAITEIRIEA